MLAVSKSDWASDPRLLDLGRRLLKRLPDGLDVEVVAAFYTKMADFGPFPLFSPEMPDAYFEPYARLRIERARAAFLAGVSEDLFSVSAYLFECVNAEQMSTYDHVGFGESDRVAYRTRQRLVEACQRFVAIPKFQVDRFRPLAQEPIILTAARHHLGNPWFLAECETVASGRVGRKAHRFDIKLWAACKLVLRLAGEPGAAPGPEPFDPGGPLP